MLQRRGTQTTVCVCVQNSANLMRAVLPWPLTNHCCMFVRCCAGGASGEGGDHHHHAEIPSFTTGQRKHNSTSHTRIADGVVLAATLYASCVVCIMQCLSYVESRQVSSLGSTEE